MKTIKEAGLECANDFLLEYGGSRDEIEYLVGDVGFSSGVAWAERWISIDTETPEPYLKVLVKGTIIHSSGTEIPITTRAWLAYDDDLKPFFTIEGTNKIINNVTSWRLIEHE